MISDTNGEQPISNMIAGVINKVRSYWFKILKYNFLELLITSPGDIPIPI